MADHIKSETKHLDSEDQEYAARIEELYSIPAAEPANEAMPANGTKRKRGSNLTEKSSGERRRIPTRASKRLASKRRGPQRLKLNGPKPPILKVNTALKIPGTDYREYKRRGNTYICPKGIMPWTVEHRWMLGPEMGIFKQAENGNWLYVGG